MQRVALYCRVSTEEQAMHGLSIEAQTEALDAWAKQQKVKVVDHYVDAGISARKKAVRRPDLQRLLSDVRNDRVDLIVFTKLDRWFRNIAEYYKVQEVLDDHKVGWKAIHEDYDTTTASGRLKVNIMLSVAQDEADRTSERIRSVFDAKRQRREPVTGHVPYGYRIDGKKIIKDSQTAAVVSDFYKYYLSARSISKAIDYVQEHHGVRLSYWTADKFLRSQAYYGEFGGISGMSPAYISKEQHEDIVANRRNVARGSSKNRTYLFSGLCFCGECGHRMAARTHHGERVEYNCTMHYRDRSCRNQVNIAESDIETFLLQNIDAQFRAVKLDALEKNVKADGPNYAADIARLRHKLSRLKELYINDLIEMDAYKRDYADLSASLADLTAKQTARKPGPNIKALEGVFVDNWQQLYADMTREEKRQFWLLCIKKITVSPDRKIRFAF